MQPTDVFSVAGTTGRVQGHSTFHLSIADMKHTDIREVLRHSHGLLNEIQKAFAAGGHTDTLLELDSLIGVAAQEAKRKLAIIENKL